MPSETEVPDFSNRISTVLLEKELARVRVAVEKTEKTFRRFIKLESKGTRSVQKALRQLRSQQTDLASRTKKATASLNKQNKAMQKHAAASRKAEKASKGFGLSLKSVFAVIGVGAIVAATRSLIGFLTKLGLAEARANALGGSFRRISDTLGDSRSQDLFIRFAQQPGIGRRFSSKTEIAGLQKLRDELSKTLGDQFGSELALRLTASFGKSNKELQEFLAQSSVSVKAALSAFASRDIENFSLALNAANQEATELSKTSISLEKAWRDIKIAVEVAFREFVERNGGDIQSAVSAISDGIVDAINFARQFAAEMQGTINSVLAGFKQIGRVGELLGVLGGDSSALRDRIKDDVRDDKIARFSRELAAETKEAQFLEARAAKLRASGDSPGLIKRIEDLAKQRRAAARIIKGQIDSLQIFKPIQFNAGKVFERVRREQEKASDAAKRQRQEIERALTPAESLALALENLQAPKELQNLQLELIESRLRAAQATPFGFGDVFQAQLDAQDKLNSLLEINRREQELVKNNGLDREDQQMRLLRLQVDENNLIAKRNSLLKAQSRGRLDAVIAEAFGSIGRFEKIIITQQKNIAVGLQKNIAKANPLLGIVGDETQRVKVKPFRFSTDQGENAAGLRRFQGQLQEQNGPFFEKMRKRNQGPIAPKQTRDIEAAKALQGGSTTGTPTGAGRNIRVGGSSFGGGGSKSVSGGGGKVGGNASTQSSEIVKTAKLMVRQLQNLSSVLSGGEESPTAELTDKQGLLQAEQQRVQHISFGRSRF